ncbi:perlucin-like [Asterias amurensis]|uniref:perlucin-like n=1 Tax=Asterias amurensis TaxID=7602 RepID=UPI003AB6D1CB
MYPAVAILTAAFYSCLYLVSAQNQQCFIFVKPTCPKLWHQWGDACYLITDTFIKWSAARDECRILGGYLAVPSSLEENNAIGSLITEEHKRAWIDCTDQESDGKWVCMENGREVTYIHWKENSQPSGNQGEDCAAINRNVDSPKPYHWFDWRCDEIFPAVCKRSLATRPVLQRDI